MLKKDQSSSHIKHILQPSKINETKGYNNNSFSDNNHMNSKIAKRKSDPQIIFNNDDNNDINKSLKRFHSISQSSLKSRDSLNEIRMIYDYYQYNRSKIRKEDDLSTIVDKYGFVISDDKKFKVIPIKDKKQHDKKDGSRSLKWVHWVSDSKIVSRSGNFGISSYKLPWNSKLFKRIFKGIPDSWRSPIWYYLITNGSTDPDFDDNLIKYYKDLLKLPSTHERQIDLDIPRTLHSHIMFRTRYGPGQKALFNVLRAFSIYDEQVGYCQGMANIVTILLMYYVEEYAFIMLTKLFAKCNLHDLYIPGFPALMESFYVQEKLMSIHSHKILNHFTNLQISSTAYATRWYITLFSSEVVPHHTLLRIWDLLMLYGFDILYFVAIALLKYNESILLSSDFDRALTMLSSSININDDNKLIKKIRKMYNKKGRQKLISTFKEEYRNQSHITI
ncbi:rab-GTPase-TBC domain-containing protein [Glomus cerebriforme]|uniref:Rab-GTPase-TBC domain-containing protein n=1 Tax=Glomus cerebriforme TaxID=658196 RepID=A0A397TAR3_9GLOM|nr:rab-GTPase-TBC domain-containing protein [Glomus cerebriforme]